MDRQFADLRKADSIEKQTGRYAKTVEPDVVLYTVHENKYGYEVHVDDVCGLDDQADAHDDDVCGLDEGDNWFMELVDLTNAVTLDLSEHIDIMKVHL